MKLNKINFTNYQYPGLSEEILDALQDNINEAINTIPLIKARINRQDINTSGTYGTVTVPLNAVEINNDNIDNYLVKENNEIVIGDDVSLVEAVLFTRGLGFYGGSGDKELMIMKNGQKIDGYYQRATDGWWGISIPTVIQVSKGDRLSAVLQSQSVGTTEILEGYLQVKVLK
ncbi:MAG: hypothetical protein ACLSW4_04095 [Clostridia bacterium]|jgi:hypothetical protein|nr:MAG TPA: hypothetical protein [Caudoviricetes sp.]